MAGLKKKKKEKSGNPNVVLVIFLVFFFLVSIGLGVWGYYGYAGQEDLRKAKQTADSSAKVEKLSKRYNQMLYRELRLAIGDKLDDKELEFLNVDRDDYTKDANGGVFKDETDKDAVKVLFEKLRKELGENGKEFKSTYEKELTAAKKEAEKWAATANAAIAKNERIEDISKKYMKNQDDFHQATTELITKENAAALTAAKTKFENFQKVADSVRDLNAELLAKGDEIGKLKEDHDKQVNLLTRKINVLTLNAAEAGGGGKNQARGGDFFPLLLDISPGRPLWDQPVGRVIRVDFDARQVVINLGSTHGVKPELTFNIFGAGTSGRGEKQLKGSIEVVKVVDASTSLARITSLYDAEGREILLNLQTRGKAQREAESPIREGDLLFNLFWGTRVAVSGYVSMTGDPSDNPAEQKRQMDDFIYFLKRNGMQVDAYVDMTNGKIEGKITSKTRYLIRGDDLRAVAEKAPPKAAEGDADKKEEGAKEAAPKDAAPNEERNNQINRSSLTLRTDARDRGLFLISAENFATVIGYRKARSANDVRASEFRPSLPYAGTGEGGVAAEHPREPEKKAPEPQKKDDN